MIKVFPLLTPIRQPQEAHACAQSVPGHQFPRSLTEYILIVLDHFLALYLRQVIQVADRVYSAAASPMKLIFPSAGPTDRC